MSIRSHWMPDLLTGSRHLPAVARRSRDNARTPMQWSGEENAGFTSRKTMASGKSQTTPAINARAQVELIRILYFSFYKQLIALRKNPEYKETVVYGALKPVCGRPPQSNGLLPKRR